MKTFLEDNETAAKFVALEKEERDVKAQIKKEVNDPAKEAGLKPVVNFKGGRKKGGVKPMDVDGEDNDADSDGDDEDSSE